ncbi:MAG: hypothetical protein IJ449_01455 [Clostridia bacterium]|nr:hypothetical protein [Clostridia bacterium]
MKNKKTALMFLLAVVLLAAGMTACGGDGDAANDTENAGTQAETTVETEPLDELEARKLVDDGMGTKDFGGEDFRILTSDGGTGYLYVEETTGDIVDDAIWTRNTNVEERFNVNINVIYDASYSDSSKYLTNLISAGEDAIDLVCMQVVEMGMLALSDYYMNWYDIPNINFEQPWWSDSTIDCLTYAGVCPIAIGDMVISAMSGTYCVYYNKSLAANYDLPNMYDVVNEGKWTLDYLIGITKGIYADLNQNGTADAEDLYGYSSDARSNMDAFLWAFDNPIFTKKGDELVYTYKTEKLNEIVTKLVDTFSQYEGISTDFTGGFNYSINLFSESRSVFSNGTVGASLWATSDLDDDMGFLPYPKWEEAQSSYYTMVDGSHQALAVPVTASNLEMIGTVTEAMNAESWKLIVPAYYDTALKVKATRDEESIAMLDLIMASRKFDFGYIYDSWEGSSFILEKLVREKNTNFESYYAKQEKSITAHYDSVIEYFANYEG